MNMLITELLPVATLHPNVHNARTHSRTQINQIAASIEAFGFNNPVLVDEANILIAGHGRLEAAKSLGLNEVPAIRIRHLGEEAKRALMLADNKIALNAGWHAELLASELAGLLELDLEIDVELTGFAMGEIDLILDGSDTDTENAPEHSEMPGRSDATISKFGDLWLLGRHKVLCGNARDGRDLALLMGGELASAGFTDPPYNVPIQGHVSGGGLVQHREFAEACGEMTSAEFTDFLKETLSLASRFSETGAVWFACMDWRHMMEMQSAGIAAFGKLLNLCVWNKTNGGMGSLYRSQHELVFVFRNGGERHRNNVQLGRYGRNRTNVWTYAGVNTFRRGRMEELTAHPTAKPVAMIKDALLDVTSRGAIVLDTFLGSGATLLAAEQSGRIARGVEIDPVYVDVVLKRWRKATGEEPVRASDGLTLAALEAGAEVLS